MNVRKLLLMLLCMCIPILVFSQTDSTKKKVPLFKKPINTTRLELTYRAVEYHSARYGTTVAYIPGVIINDARPVRIDRHGNILRRYYTKAPLANEQLDLMNQQRRRGTYQMVLGLVGGGITFFSGVVASANHDFKTGPLLTRMGIGSAIIFSGMGLKWYHSKKANEHLRQSFEIYNTRYYKPLPKDTVNKSILAEGPGTSDAPLTPEKNTFPEYKDTFYYKLLRNEPENSGMAGIMITPLTSDVSITNINFSAGIGAYYTFRSDIGISAQYNMAYIDNLGGQRGIDKPGDWDSYGVPVKYQRASRLEFQTNAAFVRWTKEGAYHIKIGKNSFGTEVGRLKGKIMNALTARMGYIIDNRIMETDNGMPFATTTPPYTYPGAQYPMRYTNLSWSTAMLRSNIVSLGFGLSTYRDMKIKLVDPDYHGRRNEQTQMDVYIDLLYAHRLKFQDIVYWHWVESEREHLPQRLNLSATPVKKIGIRTGAQYISTFASHFGTKLGVEMGLNPGPRMYSLDGEVFCRMTFGLIFGGRIASTK